MQKKMFKFDFNSDQDTDSKENEVKGQAEHCQNQTKNAFLVFDRAIMTIMTSSIIA